MEENHPRAASYSALDKISNLPSVVIDQILCRLPIGDAVRTSVLSSKWRFKWTTMSELVFFPSASVGNKDVNFIDNALLLHTGKISKFVLFPGTGTISMTDLDRWILHLSRRHVQEFNLIIYKSLSYKLHSSFFSFQDLVHLELGYCHLKLPSTFDGFKKLKSLELVDLVMAQDAFETLISSCPILERLTLSSLNKGFKHLNIDAPNLLKIDFVGCFDDMNLINCSKLEEVSIELCVTVDATETVKAWDSSNLLKFFSCLPHIKRLKIQGEFLKYFGAGDVPRQLPNPCTDLCYLWLDICEFDYVNCSVILCLLRSCPDLQELHLGVWEDLQDAETLEEDEFAFEKEFTFWDIKRMNCSFNKLQTVNIDVIVLNKFYLELIRFILLASPVLQKMTITLFSSASEYQALQFALALPTFQRASTNAKVVFKL